MKFYESIKHLRPSETVYHDNLTDHQSTKLRKVWEGLGKALDSFGNFEIFEAGFLKERNVDSEIDCWSKLDKAWRQCLKRFSGVDQSQAAQAALYLSAGAKSPTDTDGVPVLFERLTNEQFKFLRRRVPMKPLRCSTVR